MERYNKIVIVSLSDKFSAEVGESLSQILGMIFCDTKQLIEYELIDKNALERMTTKEYMASSERKVIRHIASFENVVVAISYDYLIHNLNILKDGSLIVFLNLPKSYIAKVATSIEVIDYDDRTKSLEEISTVSLDVKKIDTNFVCEKIIKNLRSVI